MLLDHFDNFWPFWPFLAIFTIFHHFSPIWTIWDHFGPFWTILDHFDHFWRFWPFFGILTIFGHFPIIHQSRWSCKIDSLWHIWGMQVANKFKFALLNISRCPHPFDPTLMISPRLFPSFLPARVFVRFHHFHFVCSTSLPISLCPYQFPPFCQLVSSLRLFFPSFPEWNFTKEKYQYFIINVSYNVFWLVNEVSANFSARIEVKVLKSCIDGIWVKGVTLSCWNMFLCFTFKDNICLQLESCVVYWSQRYISFLGGSSEKWLLLKEFRISLSLSIQKAALAVWLGVISLMEFHFHFLLRKLHWQ